MLARSRTPLFAFCLALCTTTASWAAGWETITVEDGIKVTTRDVPNRALPVFQGVGVVKASIYQVLAVISDVPRHCQWRPKCAGVKLIERVGPQELVMWSRNAAPWPVSDRDVVIRAKVTFKLDQRGVIWSTFKRTTHRKAPEIDGVVRVPHIEGFYKLERLDADRTRVTYQVNADPGGWIPKWAAARSSRGLPLNTLKGLRKQSAAMAGKYDAFIARWKAVAEPKPEPPASPNGAADTAPQGDKKPANPAS